MNGLSIGDRIRFDPKNYTSVHASGRTVIKPGDIVMLLSEIASDVWNRFVVLHEESGRLMNIGMRESDWKKIS